MSRLKTLMLMHAMVAASCGNGMFAPRRNFANNSQSKSKEELALDKGLKEFEFSARENVPYFSCYALNKKSAQKKYEKWRKKNGY